MCIRDGRLKVIEMERRVYDAARGIRVFQSESIVRLNLKTVQKRPKRWLADPLDV